MNPQTEETQVGNPYETQTSEIKPLQHEADTPITESPQLSPQDIALKKQIDMMREMQAREEIAQAQGQGEANMNPADQAGQEIPEMPEMPPTETISSSVKKMETPKNLWKWSDIDVKRFLRDFAIKMKLDKVVEGVKNVIKAPFKAFGRLWTSGDSPRTPVSSPPASPQEV